MVEHPRPDGQPLSAEELSALFGFEPDALPANRAGRLSDRQRQDLLYRCIGHLLHGLVMLMLGAALIALVRPLARTGWECALWIGVCVLWLVLGALWLAAVRDVARPQVRVATGPLRRSGDAAHPALLAGEVLLRLSYRRWKRLPEAFPGRYRAYYGPARDLLSVEPAFEDLET